MNFAITYLMTMVHTVTDRFEGRKDRGATAVEYGLMVALIAGAIILTVTAVGGQLNTLFGQIRAALVIP